MPSYTGTAELIPNEVISTSRPWGDAAKMHLLGTVTDESEAGAAEAKALANRILHNLRPGDAKT